MRVTYDRSVDAAYIYLVHIPPGGVAHTYEFAPEGTHFSCIVDLDSGDRLLGIEVLGAHKRLARELLAQAEVIG